MIARVAGQAPGATDSSGDVSTSSPSFELPPVPLRERFQRVPWAILLLSLGILLAGVAIYLVYANLPFALNLTTFILAGLSLLVGVSILMVQNLRENQAEGKTEAPRRLQIYRQTPCGIDKALTDRLDEAVVDLQQRIRDNRWQVDERANKKFLEIGRQAQADGDLMEAFRARCHAMLVQMEAIHQQRGKEESFKPLWDRAPA